MDDIIDDGSKSAPMWMYIWRTTGMFLTHKIEYKVKDVSIDSVYLIFTNSSDDVLFAIESVNIQKFSLRDKLICNGEVNYA